MVHRSWRVNRAPGGLVLRRPTSEIRALPREIGSWPLGRAPLGPHGHGSRPWKPQAVAPVPYRYVTACSESPGPRAAPALARVCLGANIFLHGLVRIPHFEQFSAKLQHQFAATFL